MGKCAERNIKPFINSFVAPKVLKISGKCMDESNHCKIDDIKPFIASPTNDVEKDPRSRQKIGDGPG